MAEMRTYPAGVPCWIDTEQHDPEAARAFYGSLFGWTFTEAMPPGSEDSYQIASLDGRDVAAIASTPVPGAPVWNTYIAVDDTDHMAERVTLEGGTVVTPPQDAGPGGRYAVCADPTGASFRLWQARQRLGAQTTNVPGAWNFSNLHCDEPVAADGFYIRLFGWESEETTDDEGRVTILWRRPGYGDHLAATVDPEIHQRHQTQPGQPSFADAVGFLLPLDRTEHEAPHWHLTFSVADRDKSLQQAVDLGATLSSDPAEGEWAKVVVIRDPQGAALTLSQFTPPPSMR